MRIRDAFLATLVVSIWSTNFIAGKLCLETCSPLFLTFMRFGLTALVLLPFVRVPKGHFLPILYMTFTLGLLHFALIMVALEDLSAGTSVIGIQCGVPFSLILSALFLKERISKLHLLGIIIAFLGVIILVGEPNVLENFWAFVLLITAAFFWAAANLQSRSLKHINPFSLNAYFSLFLTPQLLILSLVFEDYHIAILSNIDLNFSMGVLYMVFITTIFAYSQWYKLLGKYDVSVVTPFNLLGPLTGTFFSWVVLDETIGMMKIIGGLIIISGVSLIVFFPKKNR